MKLRHRITLHSAQAAGPFILVNLKHKIKILKKEMDFVRKKCEK